MVPVRSFGVGIADCSGLVALYLIGISCGVQSCHFRLKKCCNGFYWNDYVLFSYRTIVFSEKIIAFLKNIAFFLKARPLLFYTGRCFFHAKPLLPEEYPLSLLHHCTIARGKPLFFPTQHKVMLCDTLRKEINTLELE